MVTPQAVAGYVYFVQCHDRFGPVKIGHSKSIPQRLSDLRVASPFALTLVASHKCDNPREVEQALHGHLWDYRLRGEWFSFDVEVQRVVYAFRDPPLIRFPNFKYEVIPGIPY